MAWVQTHLTVHKEQAELAEWLFESLGSLSITLSDALDEPQFEPPPGATPLWQQTRISALFSADTDLDALRAELNRALSADLSKQIEFEILNDKIWEREWLKFFKPLRFGKQLWICPKGHPIDQADAIIVELDPGLAFGTGTHPTTALCLEWLATHDVQGKRVIDFGCGSGILAIAALKLGAQSVLAIDHDPQALIATQNNARVNGVADWVETQSWPAQLPEPVDLLLANILANVLIDQAGAIQAMLKPKADLVLSGILTDQTEAVAKSYSEQVQFNTESSQGDWRLLAGLATCSE